MYAHEVGSYIENEDFLCLDDPEPHVRSQNIILHSKGFKWHIKLTFNGNLITDKIGRPFAQAQKEYSIRRQQLRAFTFFIKLECLPLLENTVTETEFGLFYHVQNSSVTKQYQGTSCEKRILPIHQQFLLSCPRRFVKDTISMFHQRLFSIDYAVDDSSKNRKHRFGNISSEN